MQPAQPSVIPHLSINQGVDFVVERADSNTVNEFIGMRHQIVVVTK